MGSNYRDRMRPEKGIKVYVNGSTNELQREINL